MSLAEQEDHAYELQGKLAEAQEQINELNEQNAGLGERIDVLLSEQADKEEVCKIAEEKIEALEQDLENYRTLVSNLKKAANSALDLLEEALASE